ncbi:MAG: hypothetical protein IJ664_09250 [Clostridia bacterium]|nr:hypothetical protein [Clostridia bacterium]
MKWVQRMNVCKAQAEEITFQKIICILPDNAAKP